MRRCSLALAAIAALVITACSGTARADRPDREPAAPPPDAQAVTVTARDTMRFAPAAITVQAGQPVHVTLVNEGKMLHDFTIRDGVSRPVRIEAPPGRSASATFTLDRPGTYTFVCTVPGHGAAGMKGTLTAR